MGGPAPHLSSQLRTFPWIPVSECHLFHLQLINHHVYYEFVRFTSPSLPTAPARFMVNTEPTPGFKRVLPLNVLFKFLFPCNTL